MDLLEAIDTRSSATKLAEPAPTRADIGRMLASAARAPDHGRLAPWRFIVLEGDARDLLGDAMAQVFAAKNSQAGAEQLATERSKARRAPTIVVVAARPTAGHKVPAHEQELAVAAAVQNLLLTAHALGYGSMWKTGGPAYDPVVRRALGLADEDRIVAFVYLGTPIARAPVRPPVIADRIEWRSA